MSKTKYARGLCCFFKCKQPATVRYASPDRNKWPDDQLFCWQHWNENGKIPGSKRDSERVSLILAEV